MEAANSSQKPASPNSPNGCWDRHGYRVERIGQAMGAPTRNIYGPDGALVLADTDYDEEMAYCREHDLLLPSQD
ncbi:hypothetical protein [Comamonas sp. lk]|uniref:hypothetical protein n=1 Tax=Comamonas sp. lk TaxID=2201272 RepID=UPI000EB24668|nr:hypothetical protein [Comamonas sp. lk]